ncbi:MAG: helix-hairpin-helix domain-containing protein [Bacteroidales bacterium]|nr:helix-hairpin-helix domain-containing protein [Bacteroidales bacterium]
MKPLFKYITLFSIVVIVLSSFRLIAQQNDTLSVRNGDLGDEIENLARTNDEASDYSDLLDDYEYYHNHPININGPDLEKLAELRLMNEAQIFSVESYIKNNGPIMSLYELKYIPGMSEETLQRLSKYIVAGEPEKYKKTSWKKLIQKGRQDFLIRYEQILERISGYNIPPDSAYLKPGSVYLGTPQKLYFRYAFNAENRFRIGITTEKDAGEVFLRRNFSDSINRLLEHVPAFPDFLSAFAYVSDVGIIKKAVIGDYHLEFGQGLTLWSGLAFGASSQTCQVKYFGKGIRPNTSANENRFFRGAAVTLQKNDFQFTAFFSRKKYDANLLPPDSSDIIEISGLQETGYHRTINELLDKNSLTITVYGGQVAFEHKRFKIGAVYYQTNLDHPIAVDVAPYKLFDFHGNSLTNFGVNVDFNINPISFFGELAANPGGNPAGIAGINTFLSDRFTMTLLYRNYPNDYKVIFASPFGKSSDAANERGIYFGFNVLLTKSFTLSGYADNYSFPWLKYGADAPSGGKAYLLQMNEIPGKNLSFYFRFRFTENEQNYNDSNGYFSVLEPSDRYEYRLETSYAPFSFLLLKNRIEYVNFEDGVTRQQGFMIYQDLKFRKENSPWQATFRYALFNTGGWDSRIYTYEDNALYTFSVPALYGHGERMYLLLRWSGIKNIKVWLRASTTVYFDRQTIGSGAESIRGNHKSALICELQWKF